MKKLIIVLLISLFSTSFCFAQGWEITVKDWTMSPGPNLSHERIEIDDVLMEDSDPYEFIIPPECGEIKPEDPKECTFSRSSRNNEQVYITSYDDAGNLTRYVIGNLGEGPNPSTGGVMVSVWSSSANQWEFKVFDWAQSTGPGLEYEEVHLGGVVVADCGKILPEQPKTCTFYLPTKTNEQVSIKSFDIMGAYAENVIANTGTGPNPATGGNITIIWKP